MEKTPDGRGNKDDEGDSFSNSEEEEKQEEIAPSPKPPRTRKARSDDVASRVTTGRRTARTGTPFSKSEAAATNRNRLVRFVQSEEHDNHEIDETNETDDDLESQVDLLTLAAQRSHGIYRDTCDDVHDENNRAAAASSPGDLLESTRDNLREEKLRLINPGKLKEDYQSSMVTAELQAEADAQAKSHAKKHAYQHTTIAPHPPANTTANHPPNTNAQQRTNNSNNDDEIMPGAYQASPGQGIFRTEEFHGVLRQPLADENPSVRSSGNALPINLQGRNDDNHNTQESSSSATTPGQPAPIDYTASGEVISAVRVDEDDLELHIRDEITNNAAQAEVVDMEREMDTIVESKMERFRKRYICYGTIVLAVLAGIIIALVVGLTKMKKEAGDNDTIYHVVSLPTLEAIRERGYLNCGLTPRDDVVEYDSAYLEGGVAFYQAICTAIASAALGGDRNVSFHEVKEADRWTALKNGTFDVLLVGTPGATESLYWNLDPTVPVTFSTPFYFDGVGTAGLPDYVANCANRSGYFNYVKCRDLKVCVVQGSKAWEVAQDLLYPSQVVTVTSMDNLYSKFVAGCCNVISTDYSNYRSETMVREKTGYDGPYAIGGGLYSIQPYAVATLEPKWTYGDDESNYSDVNYDIVVLKDSRIFSGFVNWVIYSLLAAEERNITQATAERFPLTFAFGLEYRGMFRNAIKAGGNWGEIYERTRQSTVPRAMMNMLNNGTTGLHLSRLYGDLSEFGPPPHDNGTLRTILNRGALRCGIPTPTNFTPSSHTAEPITLPPFAVLPTLPGEGGMDRFSLDTVVGTANIDITYCRALATSALLGQQQQPFVDATCSLQSHDFGEVPEDLMPKLQLVILEDEGDGYNKLATGEIDVIAGYRMELQDDVHEETTGQGFTFSQPYFYGPTLPGRSVTEANRCVVTQESDDQWSSFVQSIVAALFYAEENQITQAMSNHMPLVNRFGPSYKRMFRDAVFEAGNYAEAYERSVEPVVPREGGPNMLNTEAGPQFTSRPGLI